MADLNKEIKLFIVQSLACHDTPSQVAEAVNEEFGVKIERQNVMRYDPTKISGKTLAKELVEVFHATRKAFLEESLEIPIASKIFRLRSLQRMHDYYVSRKNFVQAQSVLEQAAKEVGNVFTNKQLHGADAENPLLLFYKQISGKTLPVVPDEDLENEVFDGEVISFDAKPDAVETKPVKPAPAKNKKLIGRD